MLCSVSLTRPSNLVTTRHYSGIISAIVSNENVRCLNSKHPRSGCCPQMLGVPAGLRRCRQVRASEKGCHFSTSGSVLCTRRAAGLWYEPFLTMQKHRLLSLEPARGFSPGKTGLFLWQVAKSRATLAFILSIASYKQHAHPASQSISNEVS